MKILLCVASINDADEFLKHFSATTQRHPAFKFLSSTNILQHEADIVESGVGIFQTAYKITKVLSQRRYHQAIKISFGNAYKQEIEVGKVLNIINEKPGDFGSMIDNKWNDYYDLSLSNREDEPHVRGGFINMNTSGINIFGAYKKVVGVTVNHYADKNSFLLRKEKYKADCETGDGLGFVYPCLFEKQSFYQLCVIERNLVTQQTDFALAKKVLNETLIDLLDKL